MVGKKIKPDLFGSYDITVLIVNVQEKH